MAQRLFLIFRTALYVTGFFVTLIWLLPSALGVRLAQGTIGPSRQLGLVPLVVGAAIAFWCIANFVARGSGTPAPFDAPRKLVVSGPYCYVRNPMYIGCFLLLLGVALLFVEFSATLIWYSAGLAMAVNLLVFFYEEPTLRKKFGNDYEEYCHAVRRWIPTLRPWHIDRTRAASAE